jgi:hypothetical protein
MEPQKCQISANNIDDSSLLGCSDVSMFRYKMFYSSLNEKIKNEAGSKELLPAVVEKFLNRRRFIAAIYSITVVALFSPAERRAFAYDAGKPAAVSSILLSNNDGEILAAVSLDDNSW